MPFKKPSNKKNTTKKQQKKKALMMPSSSEDASSVEEIGVTELITPPSEAPLEEVETERIPSEEEIAAIAAHEKYMWENYYGPEQQETLKRWQDAQIAMLEDPEYWEERRSELLRQRQRFHTKGAWSAEMIHDIESLDKEIEICETTMDRLDGIEKEIPTGNPLLGGVNWWKNDLLADTDGWVSSR
jgi:hypothetical protein